MNKSKHLLGWLGITMLLSIICISLLAPVIAPYEPNSVNMKASLNPPSMTHLLGTDVLGRDIFSRILFGGRSSMLMALTATVFSMLLGMFIGTLAGYYGGFWDNFIMVGINIFQGLPGTSLMIALAGILGPSFKSLIIGLILTGWTGFARIVRAETQRLKGENYIEGLKCLGVKDSRIMWRHIIPNMKGNAIILFTTRAGRSLLAISGLSFLGLGIQPPTPDWSVMISDARMNFRLAPNLIIAPGLCIFLLLLSINLVGDMMRDVFDKKSDEAGGY
ncbi:ABC transporter permease [Fusibacter sp. 3D3]|uniref:ABC transporter permease n=1 Tax=Fusibacter sp. 3D3 TaxID=1048380 RepID=UPI0008529E86|nr:ABC transporter permease [Fusibacter sp. 3D3]GAU76493.1 dipeptide transport system permease protein DppC [Fusibacter sp. 3D3]